MAGIGMYGVYYAAATLKNGIVSGYEGGAKIMGKAISAEFEPNTPDANPLYANNGEGENDASGASGGTLKVTLDRLTMDAAADMFGIKVEEVSVTVSEEPVAGKAMRFTGKEQSKPLGVAFIRMNQEDGVRSHEVVLYRRGTFSMPKEAAQTIGEKIEWKTPELEAAIMGLEGEGENAWFEKVVFPTQAAAIQYITDYFAKTPVEGP